MMKITISRKLVIAVIALVMSVSAFAQSSLISGIVLDQSGEPVIGAAVMVKGTTSGAITDANGAYQLRADAKATIVCQLYGYKTQEVSVGGRSKIDITMVEDAQMLEETVVVGYGTLKKTQLVGSVENLSGEVIEDRPNANITRSLQGQVAGLSIVQTDGKASHSGQIHIRSNKTSYYSRTNFNSSASGSSHSIGTGGSALVLIDGVEGDLTTVNPNDVETVAVLKDASSAAIYGARGAHGVILVTTKSADKEKFSISYTGSYSLNTRNIYWEDHLVTDGLEWTEAFFEFYQNDARVPGSTGKVPTTINTLNIAKNGANYLDTFRSMVELSKETGEPYAVQGTEGDYIGKSGQYLYYGSTNWMEKFYKRYNSSTTHDINVKGSTKKLSYSLSGRFFTQEGIYKIGQDDYSTYNIRSKAKLQATKWLSIDNNTAVFYSSQTQPMFTTSSVLGKQLDQHGTPVAVPYNEDGTYTLTANKTAFASFLEGNTGQDDKNLTVTTQTGLNINIIKDVLKIRGDFSYKAIRRERERYRAPLTFYDTPGKATEYVPQASSYKSRWTYNTDYITANAVLTWTPKLGENHNLNVVAGWNLENYQYNRFYLQRKGMLAPDKHSSFEMFDGTDITVEQNDSSYGIIGFFGRINYTLFNRYIFEFSAREDGSSKFPTNSQWGFFPSGSIGWRLSEEPWMKWSRSWLDNFKIRANAGTLGNGSISPYYFLETMAIDKSSVVIDGNKVNYTTQPGVIPQSLTWERVTTYDVGIDADFFKSRLSFSGDIYRRDTDDMITSGPEIPAIFGAGSPKGNFTSMKDIGWEATLSWRDSFKLGTKDFQYSVKGSMWDTRTWITKFDNTNNLCLGYYEGKEIGEIWGFRTDGYFRTNSEANAWATDSYHKNGSNFRAYAGDLKFIDMDGDGVIGYGKQTVEDHGDLDRIGNFLPRFQYGINLDFKWNGIGLSMFFQGVGRRDWYPAVESAYFYGMYNRPYSFLMKNQTGNNYVHIDYDDPEWTVLNYDDKPYWTRRVGYCANRNVGPLTVENDYYLQNAAYIRLKNLTIDYTLPKKVVEKIKMQNIRFYCSMENLWTWSPIFKNTQMFDPEVIDTGDSDFDSASQYGLSGVGDGYSYPMLKTFTFGVNLTF